MPRDAIKTVSFFEIVRAKDEQSRRMEEVDWQRALSGIEQRPPLSRIFSSDSGSYIGIVVTAFEKKHLLIGKIGPKNLETVDLDLGALQEMHLEGNRGTIETTAVSFLPYGNIIGVMQGSMASPRISAIQNWINSCGMTTEEVATWPVISNAAWKTLKNAEAVHSFEFSYRPNPANSSPEGEGMMSYIKLGNERYEDHRITVKIEVPKTKDVSPLRRLRGQRRLRQDVEQLLSSLGHLRDSTGITRARANVTVAHDDGHTTETPLDFILHRVTAKQRISFQAATGRPRYEVSVGAILDAYQDCKAELEAAVSTDR
ncbi:hypothetical protein [Streptomyces sp. enrichment culture]|uniref:hypothetical protein n=1 Tax=Streptomyces sp. enrichment culture TaxID=1795815 RepID=UPI003F54606F